jgi:FMN phosphatase YigB (HAD superfamily)
LTAILPHLLPDALADSDAKILSLDCFDTLIWRDVHAPRDIFADLGNGTMPDQRRWAESNARARALLARQSRETTLAEIYATLMPGADDDARAAAAARELEAEARHCYAFAPTAALIRTAKAEGRQVIVVSDTYLDAAQLRALIATAAGDELAALIDRIFCSCDYGVSKGEGLFRHVLRALRAEPQDLLHIGDNAQADLAAPAALGIPARHLLQFAPETEQRLRLEAAAGAMLHGSSQSWAAVQPHRAAIAIAEPQFAHPAATLGYSVLGPIFAAFDRWLKAEATALAAASAGRVHVLFLLRDGHLPHQVWHAAGAPADIGSATAEISRFTATAASFRSAADIDGYVAREGGERDWGRLARQLLFPPREQADLIGKDSKTFVRNIRRAATRDRIVARSRKFAERLVAHVRSRCAPAPGDTIMLVDLGYNGTVQNAIDAVLREALGVEVAGRYLILREDNVSGLDKAGLFDQRRYDHAALATLCDNIAAIEQLATLAQGSVVDYAPNGAPIRTEAGVKAVQSTIRDAVQACCVEYAAAAFAPWLRAPHAATINATREAAAAILARLLFLPLESELETLAAFEHDVNLGGGEMVPLFDRDCATAELRRHGMYYMKDAKRMFLPAELRGQGLPLSLALLAQRRLALDLRRADFDEATVTLPLIVAEGREVSVQHVPAFRTHDGFLMARIPVGASRFAVGVQFGRLYDWVEVRTVEFLPAHALLVGEVGHKLACIAATPSFEQMEPVAGDLLRCLDDSAFMMVPPPAGPATSELVLSVVFRPIVARALAATEPVSGLAGASR